MKKLLLVATFILASFSIVMLGYTAHAQNYLQVNTDASLNAHALGIGSTSSADVNLDASSETSGHQALGDGDASDSSGITVHLSGNHLEDLIHIMRAHVIVNFNIATSDFQNLLSRMNSRLLKIKATGSDTTKANSDLTEANISLNTAVTETQVFANLASSTNATSAEIQAEAAKAREALVSTYTSLKIALTDLEQFAPGINSSSTINSSTENDATVSGSSNVNNQ